MNPYLGDRVLDPPEDNGCEFCDGFGFIGNIWALRNDQCPHCQPIERDPEPDNYPD